MLSRIKKFMLLWDGLWSVPLALFMFMGFGYFGEWYYGTQFGAMSPEFFHSQLYAALVIVFLNFTAWLGIYFNFRGVWRYYLQQSQADFNSLLPWQKIGIVIFLYLVFFSSGLIVTVTLV